MAENKIQAKIIKYLKAKGAYVVKTMTTNRNGVPDILCCYKGRFIGIEVKDVGKISNASALQLHNMEEIIKAGGLSIVADSVKTVEILFDNLN